MDLRGFEGMERRELRRCLEFLRWHYRVVDAFWYIYTGEMFDEATADRLSEKVWGRVAELGVKDLLKRFDIREQALTGFIKVLEYWPWHILVGYRVEPGPDEVILTVPSCPTQVARLKGGRPEYTCKAMQQAEFDHFAKAVDEGIVTACLCAPPDPHPPEMFYKWRFFLQE